MHDCTKKPSDPLPAGTTPPAPRDAKSNLLVSPRLNKANESKSRKLNPTSTRCSPSPREGWRMKTYQPSTVPTSMPSQVGMPVFAYRLMACSLNSWFISLASHHFRTIENALSDVFSPAQTTSPASLHEGISSKVATTNGSDSCCTCRLASSRLSDQCFAMMDSRAPKAPQAPTTRAALRPWATVTTSTMPYTAL